MKLDVNALRYLAKDDFRVLTAVEMGMRNARRHIQSAEESFEEQADIFEVATEDGTVLAMKLHRLGRTSFRAGYPLFNLKSEKDEEQDGSESDGEGSSRPSFLSVKKAAGSLDKELAASGFTRKEQVEMEKHGTSCSGENRLQSPPSGSNGDAKVLSQEDDNDDDSSDDADDEEDAELTKKLNKERKKAIAAAHGRRRPVSSRNTYKDKGKGTMNSKIQRQACKW
nr:unnamed protein product [Digitaria exilis]